jgi:hypothetical protein
MKHEMLAYLATGLAACFCAFRAGAALARARARSAAARDRQEYRAAGERSRRAAFLEGYAQAKAKEPPKPAFLPN